MPAKHEITTEDFVLARRQAQRYHVSYKSEIFDLFIFTVTKKGKNSKNRFKWKIFREFRFA